MSPQTVEKAKAPGWRPEAQKNVDLKRDYRSSGAASRRNSLEQAGDVLTLLALFPLTAAERVGFGVLLQRRLHRAYGGRDNG